MDHGVLFAKIVQLLVDVRLVLEDGKVFLEEWEEDVKGKRVVTNLASYAMLGRVVWKETRCHGRR